MVVLQLLPTAAFAESGLLEYPEDQLVMEGDSWTFTCLANDSVDNPIYLVSPRSSGRRKRSSTEENDGRHVFTRNDIRLKDAGTYACETYKGKGDSKSFELVVLAAKQSACENCWLDYSSQQINITCCNKFKGNKPLFLHCGLHEAFFQFNQSRAMSKEGCASLEVSFTSDFDNKVFACMVGLYSHRANKSIPIWKSLPLCANSSDPLHVDGPPLQTTLDPCSGACLAWIIGTVVLGIIGLISVVCSWFQQRLKSWILAYSRNHGWTFLDKFSNSGTVEKKLDAENAAAAPLLETAASSEMVESAVLHDITCYIEFFERQQSSEQQRKKDILYAMRKLAYSSEEIVVAADLLRNKAYALPEFCIPAQRPIQPKTALQSILLIFEDLMVNNRYQDLPKFFARHSLLSRTGISASVLHRRREIFSSNAVRFNTTDGVRTDSQQATEDQD